MPGNKTQSAWQFNNHNLPIIYPNCGRVLHSAALAQFIKLRKKPHRTTGAVNQTHSARENPGQGAVHYPFSAIAAIFYDTVLDPHHPQNWF